MDIKQAFDTGSTIPDICWLMGSLNKRKEINEFASFCAEQAAKVARVNTEWAAGAAYWAAGAAADVAARATDWADKAANAADRAISAVDDASAAEAASDAAVWAVWIGGAAIQRELKKYLVELLK